MEKIQEKMLVVEEKIDGEKIGSILTNDGRRIVYYRCADGKVKEVLE